ncbi:DUF6328 family protein [Gulosibacter sp. 10]|uniref:DUF6328 family protein n=1 Tax=Gulosibacter sp. 10 TaxID=1255570 RepID=UPI00097EEAD9|nr:DUF6328 family protein [Gulosibacter sp. 10]SJM49170.1 hypothetical protein FM112_00910 [Gulosibacter sp. 10]
MSEDASPGRADRERGAAGDRLERLRDETPAERADRNWIDVLQELRVLQTGTQILTAFLLALAFQPSFDRLDGSQRAFYLVLVVMAALSTIIALTPVAVHRFLFRRGQKQRTVALGNRMLLASLVMLSALVLGVVAFVFDIVAGREAAIIVAAVLGGLVLLCWAALPGVMRASARRHAERPAGAGPRTRDGGAGPADAGPGAGPSGSRSG